jgi:hypothetical protein
LVGQILLLIALFDAALQRRSAARH